ncbi:protein shisa-6-like [Hypanus sabinus]|uniref:protein shisa-6-like n=1 Tax=Hypanus sabinus TaxID=79690 RepID=UPI0028C3CFFC|nr:protein shisa-6-like [Hypanus sabinus]
MSQGQVPQSRRQSGDGTLQRMQGNTYHNLKHVVGSSPGHAGTLPLDRSRGHHHSRQSGLLTSCSYHNLSHLPPTYETVVRQDVNRYSSLRRLARDVEDCCQHRHLPETPGRGTLPLRRTPRNHPCSSALPPSPSPCPRRAISQDRLLSEPGHPAASSFPPLPPPRPRSSRSRERLCPSKALSYGNVSSPSRPWIERHQIVKMNSHPSAGSPRGGAGGGAGAGVGTLPSAERRQAFAAKRHSTVDQLQPLPGHPGTQIRSGSKAEVTV